MVKTELVNINSVFHMYAPKLFSIISVSVYSVSVPVSSVRCSVFGFLCTPLLALDQWALN
jgi:ACR3 family arsenite efflux pump ArsB